MAHSLTESETKVNHQRWKKMLLSSWEPRQWFEDDNNPNCLCEQETRTMWVYRKTEPGWWTVGFYSPDKEWHSESDHDSKDSAATRVRFLNGGNS